MSYHHIQRSPVQILFFLIPTFGLTGAWLLWDTEPIVSSVMIAVSLLLVVVACGFQTLTIFDEGEQLNVRYGPLPIFGKRFNYREMTGAEPGRTLFLDGWGIHFVPFRGWTFNLFGFECVEVQFGEKTVRLGTDDSSNLARFLKQRIDAKDA